MERRYIWFHTGSAFLIGTIGTVLASVLSIQILSAFGASPRTFCLCLLLTVAVLAPAIYVDQRVRWLVVNRETVRESRTTDLTNDTETH